MAEKIPKGSEREKYLLEFAEFSENLQRSIKERPKIKKGDLAVLFGENTVVRIADVPHGNENCFLVVRADGQKIFKVPNDVVWPLEDYVSKSAEFTVEKDDFRNFINNPSHPIN